MKLSIKAKIILGCIPLLFFLVGFLVYEIHQYCSVRLYNIVGLDVHPSTHYSRLFGFIGEPDRQEPCDVALGENWFLYHYDDLGLMFRISPQGRVSSIHIFSDAYRLSGRDRLRVGSSRHEVERAIRRPTSSQLAQNFWIHRTESAINLTIDKLYDVRFSFDENDNVYLIRISWW